MVGKDLRDIKYIKDPVFFFEKIRKREPFALVRFGDREIRVHFLREFKKEWGLATLLRDQEVFDSLVYKDENYYIGLLFIIPDNTPESLWFEIPRNLVKQEDKYLIDAHIFSTYPTYKNRLIFWDEFFDLVESDLDIKINWICNKDIERISPRFIDKFFFIGGRCCNRDCKESTEEILNYTDKTENELFMFSAGSYANTLIHKAWMRNKRNMYLDIGTGFEPFYAVNYERKVKVGEEFKKRKKRWEKLK